MDKLVKTFKALSDSNRIRILKMLEIKPLCVCEITEILGLAASTVSQHLSILKQAGFIFCHKENKYINYYLNTRSQRQYLKELLPLIENWIRDETLIVRDREKVKVVNRDKICGI
ncbi:MAG: metalloregulator ArsR/SmtB family transcription factor [bacterium]